MPDFDYDPGRRFPAAIAWLALAACVLGVLLFLAGCTSVGGGKAERVTKGLIVRVEPDGGVIVEDTTARAATTQPSASGLLKSVGIGAGSADELGAVTVFGAKSSVPQIVLGLALIGLGLVMWKIFSQLVLGLISVGLGIAAFLVPTALGIFALVGVAAIAGYFAWDSFRRVVRGVEAVKLGSNGNAEQIKLVLQAHASPATEAAVKAIKG